MVNKDFHKLRNKLLITHMVSHLFVAKLHLATTPATAVTRFLVNDDGWWRLNFTRYSIARGKMRRPSADGSIYWLPQAAVFSSLHINY